MGRGRAAAKGAPAAQVVAVEQQLPAFGAFRGGECVGRGRVLAGQRRHGHQRKKAKPRDREATHQVSPVARSSHLGDRSEEHTSELQSLMRISYAVICLKKKITNKT